jgi:putative nucleotidyltransferase with HDIG domain
MIKKVKVEQLRPGMFIHDLDCRWMEHPFLKSSFRIRNQKAIDKIVEHGIREAYIDSNRGDDVAHAPSEKEVRHQLESELAEAVDKETIIGNPVSRSEELEQAKEIQLEAKKVVCNVMEEVRLGKQIEQEKVEHVVSKMVDSIFRNKDALISLSLIKQKDEYTFMHSVSVCVLMISFCREMGFDQRLITNVGVGALLHDIGKMKIPQKILNKPGNLTGDEFKHMKQHVEFGCQILEESSWITPPGLCVVAEHHERYDGAGYPKGLRGEELSIYGQMASIVDVYDAMTSNRCYRKAVEPTEVLRKIFEWSKYLFKKEMVHRFIRCVGIYPVGTLVMLESGLLGVVVEPGATSLLRPVVRIVYDEKRRGLVKPYDVNLSCPEGHPRTDSIVDSEEPEKWGILPQIYLNQLEAATVPSIF